MNNFNEIWRIIIEDLEYDSIQKMCKTNKEFKLWIDSNEDYIFKKLLKKEYPCIKSIKDLYMLLHDINEDYPVKTTEFYTLKCVKENYYPNIDCSILISEIRHLLKNPHKNKVKKIYEFIKLLNSINYCIRNEPTNKDSFKILTIKDLLSTIVETYERLNTDINAGNQFTTIPSYIISAWNTWYPVIMEQILTLYTPQNKII